MCWAAAPTTRLASAADDARLELWQVLPPGNGKPAGWQPATDHQNRHRILHAPLRSLGRPEDPHRSYHWPWPRGLAGFKPDIIHCEHGPESLLALQVALWRAAAAPRARLTLYTWQKFRARGDR